MIFLLLAQGEGVALLHALGKEGGVSLAARQAALSRVPVLAGDRVVAVVAVLVVLLVLFPVVVLLVGALAGGDAVLDVRLDGVRVAVLEVLVVLLLLVPVDLEGVRVALPSRRDSGGDRPFFVLHCPVRADAVPVKCRPAFRAPAPNALRRDGARAPVAVREPRSRGAKGRAFHYSVVSSGEVHHVEVHFVLAVPDVEVVVGPRWWALRFAGVVDRADTDVAKWASPACDAKSNMVNAAFVLTGARAEYARSLKAAVICATGIFLADARSINMEWRS